MRASVIIFPGTNCENETLEACNHTGFETSLVWHEDFFAENFELAVLAGGFSYGDHISSGRAAKFSPAIKELKNFGGFILGICNGFQILCEAGFLPGALIANEQVKFVSKTVQVDFLGQILSLPIAHHQGNYFYEGELPSHIKTINYVNNPNGSKDNIAGLFDPERNILGLMPHPERAVFKEQGETSGMVVFEQIKRILECKLSLI